MHQRWADFKLDHGWRKGDRVDRHLKLHPNLVYFLELPREEQAKDRLFLAIVNALRPRGW